MVVVVERERADQSTDQVMQRRHREHVQSENEHTQKCKAVSVPVGRVHIPCDQREPHARHRLHAKATQHFDVRVAVFVWWERR